MLVVFYMLRSFFALYMFSMTSVCFSPGINVSVIAGTKFRSCRQSLMDSFTVCGIINDDNDYFDFSCGDPAPTARFIGLRVRSPHATPIHIFEAQAYGKLSAKQLSFEPWEMSCNIFGGEAALLHF